MTLFVLAYVAGVLTIVSPCILPVLPFVFARADRSFLRAGLPLLVGMALTFAVVASLAALAGGWAVEANRWGRFGAIVLLALFGLTLLFPELADRLTQPLVQLGARLSRSADQSAAVARSGIWPSLLLGIATGLLWAPCAGPVLGLILTGAALNGANAGTSLLLFAYAAGAATSLGLAILVGGRVFAAMKRSLGVGQWIRRGLGLAVLAGVAAIALGLDTGFLTQVSLAGINSVEQGLLDRLHPSGKGSNVAMNGAPTMTTNGKPTANGDSTLSMKPKPLPAAEALPVEGTFPALSGAVDWLNSPPLTAASLHGKVVLVDFWTYSCINCLRALPYVKAWAQKYKDKGLVVIGVHAPEFAFEKNIDNVKKAVARLGVSYPVAIDNNYAIWRAFNNEYWPAHYFIDAQGSIRHHHFGEGDYAGSERVIQQLLAEANGKAAPDGVVEVSATGAEAPAALNDVRSPETYIGYERAENFVSDGGATHDAANSYTVGSPGLNEWGLSGRWTVHGDEATLDGANGGIVYRFHARDLHLVLGPSPDGKPIHFRVTVDGKAPGEDHGTDTDSSGNGIVTGQRLYQLVRQKNSVLDRTFEIRFLDPGVQAYSFTFG